MHSVVLMPTCAEKLSSYLTIGYEVAAISKHNFFKIISRLLKSSRSSSEGPYDTFG